MTANSSFEPLTTSRNGHGPSPSGGQVEVCVVGAGPAGLMLAVILARLGLNVQLLDERPDQTTVGRADGIQPKTIETLQMLRLGDELLRTGVKVHDICMWRGSTADDLRRMGREVHYPADVVDVLHPFILLCHQGMVEGMFSDDLRKSGVEVSRSHTFRSFSFPADGSAGPLNITCERKGLGETNIAVDYLVGCDGARSLVRQGIPDTYAEGTPHSSVWGVIDGELDTDFPDIWSKTLVFSEEHGSVLIIPRERNMTRFYIEMKSSTTSKDLGQDYVMSRAREILKPYRLEWRSVEWFGNYQVAQRVAARFSDPSRRAFIAGDASHTHSPKAAQGMNTSVHDSWNLGWKLNLAARGLAKPDVILGSYELERKKIAHDLINFDLEHANEIAAGDAARLAENFRLNTRFISGIGVEYGMNDVNKGQNGTSGGAARPGCNLPPAKATRYIDACPIDVQLDVPMLGQFRVYLIVPDLGTVGQALFLQKFGSSVASQSSFVSRASAAARQSYTKKPRAQRAEDVHFRPERYTAASELFVFSLITATDKNKFELASLPSPFSQSHWTVYLDDVPHLDTQGQTCTRKWLGGLQQNEVAVVNVRPDGYVGSISRWDAAEAGSGEAAAQWLDSYFGGFLQATS